MDFSFLIVAVILGIAAEYPLRSLMLFERDSHEGPFKSKNKIVLFPSSGHMQHASIFDWIRRLFRVYKLDDMGYWVVKEDSVEYERVSCQHCLSWWVAIPFALGIVLVYFGVSWNAVLWFIPVNFLVSVVSQLAYKVLWELCSDLS